jgi:hypothetical protein
MCLLLRSLRQDSKGESLQTTLHAASSKKNITPTHIRTVESERFPGQSMTVMAFELFLSPRGQRILPEVYELDGAFVRLPGRGS